MNIKFTSKNVKFTGPQKAFVEKRLRAIEKISGDMIESEMVVNEEKLTFKVELIIKTKLHSYQIEENDSILKQAMRKSLNNLKTQARKNKEKLKEEKKRSKRYTKKSIFNRFMKEDNRQLQSIKSDTKIVVSDNFSPKPLTIDEAVFFLKESGEKAFMFMNADGNKMSVVFYNKNNEISIIEANQ